MKKTMKAGLFALLFATLAMCFVSCGVKEPSKPDSGLSGGGTGGGGSGASGGGVDEFYWTEETNTLDIEFKDGTDVTIHITSKGVVTIGFTSGDGSKPVYDKAMFQGATTSFDDPEDGGTDAISFFGDEENLPPQLYSYWVLDFTQESDSSVIFSIKIPREWAEKLFAVLND